jgi:hypothetical protein
VDQSRRFLLDTLGTQIALLALDRRCYRRRPTWSEGCPKTDSNSSRRLGTRFDELSKQVHALHDDLGRQMRVLHEDFKARLDRRDK